MELRSRAGSVPVLSPSVKGELADSVSRKESFCHLYQESSSSTPFFCPVNSIGRV